MKRIIDFIGCFVVSIATFGYLIPSAVAIWRGLKNAESIFVVNLLTGWTLIGWVVALAWAVSGTAEIEP